jgi:hypothetical protein
MDVYNLYDILCDNHCLTCPEYCKLEPEYAFDVDEEYLEYLRITLTELYREDIEMKKANFKNIESED